MRATARFLFLLVLSFTLGACGGSSSGRDGDTTPPVITLTGDNPQVIEAGSAYVEMGATATDNRDGDLTDAIVIDARQVDSSVPGNYVVHYDVSDNAGNDSRLSRTVIVQDTTPPVITLTGDNPQVIEAGGAYVEMGATATDNRDGDLTNAIVIDTSQMDTSVPGSYVVHYDVSDNTGNDSRLSRTVFVQDTTPPVITLIGDNPQAILAGSPYVELGFSASDNIDGDISNNVIVEATGVDLSMTGNYLVTYDVTDSSGNPAATVTRLVRVLVTGEWRQTGSMIQEWWSAGAVLLGDGSVLVSGSGQAETFDPVTEQFTLLGEAPSGVPVVLADGRVLFAGMGGAAGIDPSSIYDPVAGTFRDIGPMNRPRRGFSATLLSDGRVLIVGGRNWWPECEVHDSAEIFDPVTETFALTDPMSFPRSGHTATLLNDGTVLIIGGYDTVLCDFGPAIATLRSAEIYDPATGTFQQTGSMPDSGVFYNTSDILPDGNVLVVVGTEGWEGQKNVIYEIGTGTFVEADDMATHRGNHRAVALKSSATCDGPVMIIGGSSFPTSGLSSAEMYDPDWGRFYSTADMPDDHAGGHAAVLLEDGRVLVAGGYNLEGSDEPIPLRSALIFEPIGGCP